MDGPAPDSPKSLLLPVKHIAIVPSGRFQMNPSESHVSSSSMCESFLLMICRWYDDVPATSNHTRRFNVDIIEHSSLSFQRDSIQDNTRHLIVLYEHPSLLYRPNTKASFTVTLCTHHGCCEALVLDRRLTVPSGGRSLRDLTIDLGMFFLSSAPRRFIYAIYIYIHIYIYITYMIQLSYNIHNDINRSNNDGILVE